MEKSSLFQRNTFILKSYRFIFRLLQARSLGAIFINLHLTIFFLFPADFYFNHGRLKQGRKNFCITKGFLNFWKTNDKLRLPNQGWSSKKIAQED